MLKNKKLLICSNDKEIRTYLTDFFTNFSRIEENKISFSLTEAEGSVEAAAYIKKERDFDILIVEVEQDLLRGDHLVELLDRHKMTKNLSVLYIIGGGTDQQSIYLSPTVKMTLTKPIFCQNSANKLKQFAFGEEIDEVEITPFHKRKIDNYYPLLKTIVFDYLSEKDFIVSDKKALEESLKKFCKKLNAFSHSSLAYNAARFLESFLSQTSAPGSVDKTTIKNVINQAEERGYVRERLMLQPIEPDLKDKNSDANSEQINNEDLTRLRAQGGVLADVDASEALKVYFESVTETLESCYQSIAPFIPSQISIRDVAPLTAFLTNSAICVDFDKMKSFIFEAFYELYYVEEDVLTDALEMVDCLMIRCEEAQLFLNRCAKSEALNRFFESKLLSAQTEYQKLKNYVEKNAAEINLSLLPTLEGYLSDFHAKLKNKFETECKNYLSQNVELLKAFMGFLMFDYEKTLFQSARQFKSITNSYSSSKKEYTFSTLYLLDARIKKLKKDELNPKYIELKEYLEKRGGKKVAFLGDDQETIGLIQFWLKKLNPKFSLNSFKSRQLFYIYLKSTIPDIILYDKNFEYGKGDREILTILKEFPILRLSSIVKLTDTSPTENKTFYLPLKKPLMEKEFLTLFSLI